jgi:DNA-binding transcriptional MerR regulator
MSAYFRKLTRKAGLKGSIHILRHTFASHLVQAGVSLKVVKDLLGHSSMATTEIYAHVLPRLAVVQAGLDAGAKSARVAAAEAREKELAATIAAREQELDQETARLRDANAGWAVEFETASGSVAAVPLDGIVRAWQPNRLSPGGSLGVYLSRWGEFLADDPREANSAGGVFPAIWGTVTTRSAAPGHSTATRGAPVPAHSANWAARACTVASASALPASAGSARWQACCMARNAWARRH